MLNTKFTKFRIGRFTPSTGTPEVGRPKRITPIDSESEKEREKHFDAILEEKKSEFNKKKTQDSIDQFENVPSQEEPVERFHNFWAWPNEIAVTKIPKKILFGFDGSPEAEKSLSFLNTVISTFDAELFIQLVLPLEDLKNPEEKENLLAKKLSDHFNSTERIHFQVIPNKDIAQAFVDTCLKENTQLLFLADKNREGKDLISSPSLIPELFFDSPCPLWIHKNNVGLSLKKILVLYDGTPFSLPALKTANLFAESFESEVFVFHAIEESSNKPQQNINELFAMSSWQEEATSSDEILDHVLKAEKEINPDLTVLCSHKDPKLSTLSLEITENLKSSVFVLSGDQ